MQNLNDSFLATKKYFTKNVVRSPIGALPKVSRWKVKISNTRHLEGNFGATPPLASIVIHYMITFYLFISHLRPPTTFHLPQDVKIRSTSILNQFNKKSNFRGKNMPE